MTLAFPDLQAPGQPGRLVERLTDASRLAGRFAHDFDNVLMGVMGFAELAQGSVPRDSDAFRLLTSLLLAAEQGRAATRQLHRFSHSARRALGSANLSAVWAAEMRDLCAAMPAAARCTTAFSAVLPDVSVPADALRAVIGCVVSNAFDAAGATGSVNATAVATERDETTDALPDALPAGDYVELTVTDDGPGFKPDILARVADTPFLTTKVRHRGLGLSIALLTLATHGGGLRIDPATPRGTRVTIYLPTHRNDSER